MTSAAASPAHRTPPRPGRRRRRAPPGRGHHGRGRGGQPRHGGRGHPRHRVPDRLAGQDVDGHRADAARRRGPRRPRRPGAHLPPHVRRRRSQRLRGGDIAASVVAHERHRRRQLRRLRTRRRLPRAVRRIVCRPRADPSPRRHHVLLQHRIHDHRTGDRGDHRQGVGRGDARAAVRAARPDPHRHPSRGGAAPPGCGRSHLAVARSAAAGRTGVDAASRLRTDGADQLHRRRRAHVCPPAPRPRRHRRTATGSSPNRRSGRCTRPRSRVRTRTPSARIGASASSSSIGTGTPCTATTAPRSASRRGCASCPTPTWPSPWSPMAATPSWCTRTLFGDLLAELAGIAMPAPLAPADRSAGRRPHRPGRRLPASLGPLRPRARRRPARRNGDVERSAGVDRRRPGDGGDAHARRRDDVPAARGGGLGTAIAGGVLRVPRRRAAVPPQRRPGQPPRRR